MAKLQALIPTGTTVMRVNSKREPISIGETDYEFTTPVTVHRDGTLGYQFADGADVRRYEVDAVSVAVEPMQ